MRRMRKQYQKMNNEFELDLAPLLAVMVKLVPVLLVSSAFVQVMMIETDLPQTVKEAIQRQEDEKFPTSIQVEVDKKIGVKIRVTTHQNQNNKQEEYSVPLNENGNLDYLKIHEKFVEIKDLHPEVFKIYLLPSDDIRHEEIVHLMDEARKAREKTKLFPLLAPNDKGKDSKETQTPFMFPDVTFANVFSG